MLKEILEDNEQILEMSSNDTISKIKYIQNDITSNLSTPALKGEELLNGVIEYMKNLGYNTPKIPTNTKNIRDWINGQVHEWGMNASSGDEEDMEARGIQRKWEVLWYKHKDVTAYLNELSFNKQAIKVLDKTISELKKIK